MAMIAAMKMDLKQEGECKMSDLSTELKYCEDYCPIYNTLKSYNESHQHQIMCLTAMCAHITEICELNREEVQDELE